MTPIRVLVANEPSYYREVIAAGLSHLRPRLEVVTIDPAELDGAVIREAPQIVICSRLTVREREVLQALADGLSDREIAARFNVSTKTVRAHMANLLAKLNVDSRLQALIFAVRHGVVEIR